jgi:hypothetical protein
MALAKFIKIPCHSERSDKSIVLLCSIEGAVGTTEGDFSVPVIQSEATKPSLKTQGIVENGFSLNS